MFNARQFSYLHLYTVLIVVCCSQTTFQAIHGRYTRDISEYQLAIPHRASSSGEFMTFSLPQYFEQKFEERYKRDVIPDENKIHYNVAFDGAEHHVELWPNHGFVSPNLVTEVYEPDLPVAKRKLNKVNSKLCHYVGRVRGHKHSSAALSLCDGLAGYLTTDNGQYFIEPLAEHGANEHGAHVHVVYRRTAVSGAPVPALGAPDARCGTRESWTDAWTRRLRDEISKRQDDGTKHDSTTHNIHRYLELLVVADKKFLTFHKNIEIENYILTIINMVSNFYHDASAGNQMDVSVVRIMYLEKEEEHFDLTINQDAENTLDSFCNWQIGINPKDVHNPQHHDIAVLLTRYDLCSDNVTDCGLMGLAFVGTACKPEKSCAINEDSGLALGITVAHEVGHVMGCSHDNGEDSPCQAQDTTGDYFIMSPYVHMQTTKWSPCSKKFMMELFENRLGDCLNDEPEESLFKESEMPPGSVYGADFQCNLAYSGTTQCLLENIKICETLYCQQGDTCVGRSEPPADGTKCAENMWCYNGKCVEIGERPQAVDGGWGEWGEWTKCSRTCGGGVQFSERDCNNPPPKNRGRFCLGERKKVKLCNIDPCEKGRKTFREVQCEEYNNKPYHEKLHSWKPLRMEDKPCSLFCVNEEHVYVEFSQRVKDGTSCKRGTKNKCISGICRNVGCDLEIDSKAVEDECGVCNGDGTHCNIIKNVFEESGNGYIKIAEFPPGARNLRVNEKKASENTIAVSAEDGQTFYLNGNFREEENGDKDFGGVEGLYDHPEENKETLFVAGPLVKPLILYEVFYQTDSPGVEYSYAEPLPAGSIPTEQPVYYWDFVEFEPCSAQCGHGIKTSKATCVEKKRGKVADKYCESTPKPEAKTMDCNDRPCKTKWKANSWGKCSGCKFRSGVKIREVDCVRESSEPNVDPIIVEDSECKEPKPATKKLCCSNKPCPKTRRTPDELEEQISRLWHQVEKYTKRDSKQNENSDNSLKEGDVVHAKIREKNTHTNGVLNGASKVNREPRRETHHHKSGKTKKINIPLAKRKCPSNATLIKDRLPPEGNRLIKIPIKQSHNDVKLSDAAYQAEGDKVVDTLDFCHEQIFTGKSADKELKKMKANATG